ncbi:MAG: membrane protein insertase YidC [Akkermansiaceae bacterium]
MDRKGWIILTICAVLLALNFYYMPDTPPAEPTPKESKEDVDNTGEKPNANPDVPPTNPSSEGGLVVEPSVETVGENTAELVSMKDGEKIVTYTFTSRGGGMKSALLHNQLAVGSKTQNIVLNADAPAPIGALGEGPDDYLLLDYDQKTSSKEKNAVYYTAKTPDGLKITKRWALVEDKDNLGAPWLLTLDITFRNEGESIVNLQKYTFFNGTASPLHPREWADQGGAFYLNDGSFENATTSSGAEVDKGFFSSAQSMLKEGAEELEYAGVSNQFFTTLVRPSEKYSSSFWAKSHQIEIPGADDDKKVYAVRSGFDLPASKIAAGDYETLSYTVYVGPKHYGTLKKMEGNVDEVLNYGWFTPISVILSNTLNWLHDVAFSKTADKWAWGLSIIALTILIRIVIWPLHNKSTRTMKRMSKLQPLMKDLREKYKDNPQKLNQETMKLYKQYQINPMGGCLPMFLQIPIFFGYYRMLQYAVELRGESFLWVEDLSMPDTLYTLDLPFSLPLLGDQLPINILPILMAVTMVLQMKMTPNTGDKMQRRIMMFMPLMFFFFCYNFASALALYWTTQNIFSIGQTWLMNRMPEPELKKRSKPGKPGKKSFMERMAERAEAMQEAQEAAKQGGGKKPMRDATPAKKSGKKRPPRTGG